MKRLWLSLVFLIFPSFAFAQAITSYTLTIYQGTTVVSTTVISPGTIAASVQCNQAPWATGSVINPTRFEFDDPVNLQASVNITGNTVANPTVILTATPHGYVNGQTVVISSMFSGSVPDISGTWTATVIDTTHFSIPLAVTTAGGSSGTVAGKMACQYGPDPPTGPLNSLPFGAAQYTAALSSFDGFDSGPSLPTVPFTHPGTARPAPTGLRVRQP